MITILATFFFIYFSAWILSYSAIHEKWQSCTVKNEEFISQNRSTDVCLCHYTSTNPVLPPVLFSQLSPDSSKLLPTLMNKDEQ